jgi:hypothetical protein
MSSGPARSRSAPRSATQKKPCAPDGLAEFLAEFRAAFTVVSEQAPGVEHVLDQPRVLVGRGPGVDFALNEPSLERVHAALEFQGSGYGVRCIAEEGEVVVNGAAVAWCELKNEDRFQLGTALFAYLLERRRPSTL